MTKYIKLSPNFHLIINPAERFYTEFNLTFAAGGSYPERKDQRGLTHLLEHCIIKETEKYPHEKLNNLIFEKDLYRNASTGPEIMDITLSGHKSNIDVMLELILEFAFKPKITQETLDTERQIVLREKNQRNGDPGFKLYRLIMRNLYKKGSKARHDPVGRTEALEKATLEQLYEIHKRILNDSHIVLNIVGGDVDEAKITKVIEPYLKLLPEKANQPVDFTIENVLKPFSYKPVVNVLAHDHSRVIVAVPCTVKMENRAVRNFLAEMLFSSPTGIFFSRLRKELGLLYSYNYSYDESTQYLAIDMTTDIPLIKQLLEEIQNIFTNFESFLTEEKVNIIKDIYLKRQEINSDNPYHPADFLGNSLLNHGIPMTYEEYLKQIKAITTKDVLDLYNELKGNLSKTRVMTVSNKKDIETLEI